MSEEHPEVQTMEQEGFIDVMDADRDLGLLKAQLESLLTATDSLESLMQHLDTHAVTDDAHRHALRVSVENLLTGSGLQAHELLPALNESVEGTVSTESLKDQLKALWKRLVSMVLSVIRFLKHFWERARTFRGRLRMSAEHLAKHASVRRHVTVREPTVQLGMEVKSFIVGDRVMTDPDSLIRSISAALDQYRIFTTHYSAGMLTVGQQLERALQNEPTGADKLKEVSAIVAQMPIGKIASQMKAMVYRDPRFGRRLTMAAPPLIGGWTLFFLSLEPEQQALRDTDPLAYSSALRTTGIKFALTNVNLSNLTSGAVKTASGQQVEALARRVIEVLDLIDAQEQVLKLTRIESQIKNVLRAGEQYQNRVSHSSDSYDLSVLRFVRNYASWAIGPTDQLTTNLLTVSRNLLTYGRKSLNFH